MDLVKKCNLQLSLTASLFQIQPLSIKTNCGENKTVGNISFIKYSFLIYFRKTSYELVTLLQDRVCCTCLAQML